MSETQNLPTTPKQSQGTLVTVLEIVVVGGTLYGVWKVGKGIYDSYNLKKGVSTETDPKNKIKKGYTISGKPIGAAGFNLTTIASDIYSAINPPFYGIVDQQRAVTAFLNTPFGYVNKLQELYASEYSQDLKKRLSEQLSDINFTKIKYYF